MNTSKQKTNIKNFSNFKELSSFESDLSCKLAIIKKEPPTQSEAFFSLISHLKIDKLGLVRKEYAEHDIKKLIKDVIPEKISEHPFFNLWISDMTQVSEGFLSLFDQDIITIWIGTERTCGRYHVDNVPFRALVTYAGKGTEYLPDSAADRKAYESGQPNSSIIANKSKIRWINQWDVAIFKGGAHGLLHRTPDESLNGFSVMMRLDNPDFFRMVSGKK